MTIENEKEEFKLKVDEAFFVIFGIAFLIIIFVGVHRSNKRAEQEFLTSASVEDNKATVDISDFVGDYQDEDENELHIGYIDGELAIDMVRTHFKDGGSKSMELNTSSLEGNVLYVCGTDPNSYSYEGKLIYEKGKVTLISTDSHWSAASDGRQFIFIKK